MFTGIIEATARIMRNEGDGIVVRRPPSFGDISVGSSVAVAGVCLTVSALDDRSMTFDLTPETLRVTKLKDLQEGGLVNLERAMKMGDRFDGHVVQGHVEGTGIVTDGGFRVAGPENRSPQIAILTIQLPEHLLRHIILKGSIAIDGVSLTVASVEGDRLTIALIPHTLEHTTLGNLKDGDRVNVETDIMTRTRTHAH